MSLTFDFSLIMADVVGDRAGLTESELKDLREPFSKTYNELKKSRENGEILIWELPGDQRMLDQVAEWAEDKRKQFDSLVVLGIGGSALGAIALHTSLNHLLYNLLPQDQRKGPRFFCPDNVDPDYFGGVLDVIDPKTTLFNVVSKSGSTAETIAQFLVILDLVKRRCGSSWREHLVITTDPHRGFLREFASTEKVASFSIPPQVGGRFSLFTPVCLLPAAMVGIEIHALAEGARKVSSLTLGEILEENPTAFLAGCLYLLQTRKGLSNHVLFAYSNRLYSVADWFRQLWSESLGKKVSLSGETVFTGPTPIKALGATDQHSQVQLYVEGPYDKAFVMLGARTVGKKLTIPPFSGFSPHTDYLRNADMGDLLNAERLGTTYALAQAGRPVITIEVEAIDPLHIGALMFTLEVATLYGGGFYRVNPLDQPGVEAGKIATFALMGHRDHQGLKSRIEHFFTRQSHLVFNAPLD